MQRIVSFVTRGIDIEFKDKCDVLLFKVIFLQSKSKFFSCIMRMKKLKKLF